MSRYTKVHSNYILTKRSQEVSGGVVSERDFVTIGERHRLDYGKKVYFSDSNFMFTDNSTSPTPKRHNYGKWVSHLNYNDVKNATAEVNTVEVNYVSEDLRDFVYYGSCADLVSGTVEHIVAEFPARIKSTDLIMRIPDEEGTYVQTGEYVMNNQFMIDLHHDNVTLGTYENSMRYMSLSWPNYQVSLMDSDGEYGTPLTITSYTISEPDHVLDNYLQYHEYGYEYVLYNGVLFKWNENIEDYQEITYGTCTTYFVKCDEYIRTNDDFYLWDEALGGYTKIDVHEVCIEGFERMAKIVMTLSDSTEVTINAYRVNGSEIYSSLYRMIVQPFDDYIEDYFLTLTGFERFLLTRSTTPYYTNSFVYLDEDAEGVLRTYHKRCTWPSDDYCIDIESNKYYEYISSLAMIAESLDNHSSDCIWRCMTHESVKNFDWSYRMAFSDNDAEENIEGGNRMMEIMRFMGLVFDDVKRDVDGIGMHSVITYDGCNNMPDAEISDRNSLSGWDVTSTIYQIYYYTSISESDIPSDSEIAVVPTLPVEVDSESPEYISVGCDSDATFYVKETVDPSQIYIADDYLSQTYISKGNTWLTTNVCGYAYVRLSSKPTEMEVEVDGQTVTVPILDSYWTENTTYPYVPTYVYASSLNYIRVLDNNTYTYYQKVSYIDHTPYEHDIWYSTRNSENVTPMVADLDFQRRLALSTKRIFESKGTQESIEMVLGMFGLGKGVDYTLTERYRTTAPKNADDTFYYYRLQDGQQVGTTYTAYSTLPYNVDSTYPAYIKVGTASPYKYFELDSMTVGELIEEITANKSNASEYSDAYGGAPVREVVWDSYDYLIPYYENGTAYDGNMYPQMYGGWGKKSTDFTNEFDYSETINYLHVIANVGSLMAVAPISLNSGDIYYVADLSDYYTYASDTGADITHFFKVVDQYNPQKFSSWANIPLSGGIQYSTYVPPYTGAPDHDDYVKATYLNGIVYSTFGNNPHCGYGKYDGGEFFFEVMANPYKFSVDNGLFTSERYRYMADQLRYTFTTVDTTDSSDKLAKSGTFVRYYYDSGTGELTSANDTFNANGSTQYYTDKLLIISNLLSSSLYNEYFTHVIAPYLMQVVPSTTILVFDGFTNTGSENVNEYTITLNTSCPSGDSSCGVVYGGGSYPETDYAVLRAVAAEGYHFSEWIDDGGNTVSTDEIYRVMVCGDASYTAVFKKNCVMVLGCDDRMTSVFDCKTEDTYPMVYSCDFE